MRVLAVRFVRLVAVLLAVTFASFAMVSLLPGDIVTALPGAEPRPQRQQQERRHADVGRQLHLLVDQHQCSQPQGME